MKRNVLIWATILFASFSLTFAQVSQDDKRLKNLDSFVEELMQDLHVVGAAIAIVKDGTVVHAQGYGYTDSTRQNPVTPYTQFAIGSASKAFTAMAVCQLASEGLIDLDEPLRTYLPDFKLYDDYATQNMTPRDLLCHNSGLPRHDLVWYGAPKSRKELFESLAYLEPTVSFRKTFQYQNLMFMTAGYLVEKVTGKTWERYVEEHIFNPLSMATANFSVEDMQEAEAFAYPYTYDFKDKTNRQVPFRNIDAIGPAGSINASIREMANWLLLQLGDGTFEDHNIIEGKILQQMHLPHMVVTPIFRSYLGMDTDEFFHVNYGLGWFITSYRGKPLITHGGHIDGFSADVSFFPKDDLGIVILINQSGSPANNPIRNQAADLMLGLPAIDWKSRTLEKIEAQVQAVSASDTLSQAQNPNQVIGTQASHELASYAGTYEHPGYGELRIIWRNDSLLLQKGTGISFPLTHYHYDIFTAGGGPIQLKAQFHTDLNGRISQVQIPFESGVDPIRFDRKVEVNPEKWTLYEGKYQLLTQVGEVFLQEANLYLKLPGQPEYELNPIDQHKFEIKSLEGYTITFVLNEDKESVSELISSQPNGIFKMIKLK